MFQFLPISSNFAQPLNRSGLTFHRPQSTTWSTLCEGDVLHCVRQMVVTPDTDWFTDWFSDPPRTPPGTPPDPPRNPPGTPRNPPGPPGPPRTPPNKAKLHVSEWPFIVASLRHTCALIMLSNQHLDMPHLWGGMDYLGKGEVLTITDLGRFVNNIWEKCLFCVYRKCFRSLSSSHEKWEQKQKCCIYIFVQCMSNVIQISPLSPIKRL